ncbi:transcription initiation factor IIB-like [Lolium rigidum]|uniref:transcription initiation factor IIB-like n=1 Tax=Lolium rigidum TaxID=89674 RepID=UPI001F5DEAE3|nr:transcription initiation factor IIB-like [Lolium rigidum]
MESSHCKDCNVSTVIVLDHATGDTICSECGLVLDSHYVDEKPDWRTSTPFASNVDSYDPISVAESAINLKPKHNSTTAVRLEQRTFDHHQSLHGNILKSVDFSSHQPDTAFHYIADMADRLGIVDSIKLEAKNLYMKANDLKLFNIRKKHSVCAACLYIACRQANKARTIKEICTVTNGVTRKEVSRAKDLLVQHIEEKKGEFMEINSVRPRDLVRRFCSTLGMSNQAIQAAEEAANRVERLDIRRNAISIAGTIIYLISESSMEPRDKVSIKDICLVAGLTEVTIRYCHRELCGYASWLLETYLTAKK